MKQNKDMNPLTNIERVAVAASMGNVTEIKKELASGSYSGSVVVKIDYTVGKSEDTDALPTSNILAENVIALAVVKMGAMGDHFLTALRSAALEAAAVEKTVGQMVLEKDDRVIAKLAEIRTEVTGCLPRIKKSGATKVTSTITKVASGAVQVED